MEEFKKLMQENGFDNPDETDDDTFSTLLDEIEICANFHTSFKDTRTNGKSKSVSFNFIIRGSFRLIRSLICSFVSRIAVLTARV